MIQKASMKEVPKRWDSYSKPDYFRYHVPLLEKKGGF
jgi:hypothetical protein